MKRAIWLGALCVLFCAVFGRPARADTGTISVSNSSPAAGTPIAFTIGAAGPLGPPATTLLFGDGSPAVALSPPYPVSVTHSYATPGVYTAVLLSGAARIASATVTVLIATPRVPQGQIFSTVPIASTVLAGDDTNVLITYRVVAPPPSPLLSSAPSLQAIVDLLDEHDQLISRGDPVLIPNGEFAGGGVQTAEIPYTIPSDARGTYHVRVYLRSAEIGGDVARGQPVPILITGGPDPAPNVTSDLHINGAIEAGPRVAIGGTAGTAATSGPGGELNANVKLGVEEPSYTFTAASTLNPTSRLVDPLLTLVPGAGDLNSPNAQPPAPVNASATPAPLHYQHVVGPSTAPLPSLLFNGGETLRGLDSQINQSGWAYQGALGFPQIATSTSGQQTGYLLNVARTFAVGQSLEANFLENIDDASTFVPIAGSAPLLTQAGGLEYSQPLASHLILRLGDALSGALPLSGGGAPAHDGADKADLAFAAGPSSIEAEYHNFGSDFATGNGLGATSDSAGGSVNATFGLGASSSLAVTYAHDFTRSAPSSSADEGATFSLRPSSTTQITLTGGEQHMLNTTTDTTDRNASVLFSASKGSSTISLGGNLATVTDVATPENDGVTRSAQLQYAFSHGPANVSIALNALGNQLATPSSTFAESLTASIPLGRAGNAVPASGTARAFGTVHGFELQISAGNANTTSAVPGGSATDLTLGAVLAYHLGAHVALGLHALSNHHWDPTEPADNSTTSALRARLDVQL